MHSSRQKVRNPKPHQITAIELQYYADVPARCHSLANALIRWAEGRARGARAACAVRTLLTAPAFASCLLIHKATGSSSAYLVMMLIALKQAPGGHGEVLGHCGLHPRGHLCGTRATPHLVCLAFRAYGGLHLGLIELLCRPDTGAAASGKPQLRDRGGMAPLLYSPSARQPTAYAPCGSTVPRKTATVASDARTLKSEAHKCDVSECTA